MLYKKLIQKSHQEWTKNPVRLKNIKTKYIFSQGAEWMFLRLSKSNLGFDQSVNYTFYGFLKYGVSLLIFFTSIFLFSSVHILLLPFSLLIFYIIEVHFLFLFPLLLDHVPYPLLNSISHTYRLGLLKTAFTTFSIGLFMTKGLFNLRDPFKNWYLGCLCILIWYKDEVRNRL